MGDTVLKKGILSADGARRLSVPHLAGSQVDYELKRHERLGEYAGEIYHQGTRLGRIMVLGSDGIIPCDYMQEMRSLLASLDKDGARELAAKELAYHGHPDAPEWAISAWLDTYEPHEDLN